MSETKSTVNFSDFRLKEGTFRQLPWDDALQHWAGMPKAKKKLEDIVQSVRSDDIGQSEFVIMCGAWGSGKTHAMRYFAREIMNKGDGYVFYAGDVKRGHKMNFVTMFKQIIEENKKMLLGLASHVRTVLEKEYGAAGKPDDYKKFIEDKVKGSDDASLIYELYKFGHESDVDKIVNILTSSQQVTDDHSAANMLATLVKVMTLRVGNQDAQYKAVYIFLDEMESALDLRPEPQYLFFAALRRLIDGTADGYCGILLAFSVATAVIESQMEPALWERMTRKLWEFEHLDTESAKHFVREYLKTRRLEEASPSNPYFPFSEDAISWILERDSQIVPRKILREMGSVFERAVRNEKVEPGGEIPLNVAEEILSEIE